MMIELFREGIRQVVILATLPLIIAAIVAVFVSIMQAATQIQDQTSAFLIRMVAFGGALFFVAPALSRGAIRFTIFCFQTASVVARGG